MYAEFDRHSGIEENLTRLKDLLHRNKTLTVSTVDPHIADLLMITHLLQTDSFCKYDIYTQKHGVVVEMISLL